MRLAFLLLVACKIVHTDGDASMPALGELYRCLGTITCPDVEPFPADDQFCLPRDSLDQTIAVFEALYPDCRVDGFCRSVGGIENGGVGISRPCVLDEAPDGA